MSSEQKATFMVQMNVRQTYVTSRKNAFSYAELLHTFYFKTCLEASHMLCYEQDVLSDMLVYLVYLHSGVMDDSL